MKKLLSILFFFFTLSTIGLTKEKDLIPFEKDGDSYLLSGKNEAQYKIRMSFRYRFFPQKYMGLYWAYKQTMFWDAHKESSPFKDIIHEPVIYYETEFFKKVILRGGYWHKSNGMADDKNRSIDRFFGQFNLRFGDKLIFGSDYKYWHIYTRKNGNKMIAILNYDIERYVGSWEHKLFLKLNMKGSWFDREEIYVRYGAGGGRNGFDFRRGWQEWGLKIRIPILELQPRLFLQIWNGYGETLVYYNRRATYTRIGIVF